MTRETLRFRMRRKNFKKLGRLLINLPGIAGTTSCRILSSLRLSPRKRYGELSSRTKKILLSRILRVAGSENPWEIRQQNKLRLLRIGTIRGWRLANGQPVRGQRTRSNGNTQWRLQRRHTKGRKRRR